MLEVIQEALEGKDQRVLLCPSARSGKTTCLILGLVWALYRWPTGAPQLLISSTQRHASNVAKKTIALFRASGGRLHPKSKSSQEWAPNWADGLTSQVVIIGRTTSALGLTASCLWLDDVVGSFEDASNPTFMRSTISRFGSDWLSRCTRRLDGSGSCLVNVASVWGPTSPHTYAAIQRSAMDGSSYHASTLKTPSQQGALP